MVDIEKIGDALQARSIRAENADLTDLENAAVESGDLGFILDVCWKYLDRGDLQNALRVLDRAEEVEPDTYEVSLQKASIYSVIDADKHKAAEIWSEISKEEEETCFSIEARIHLLFYQEQYNDALDEYSRLEKLYPNPNRRSLDSTVIGCLIATRKLHEAKEKCLELLQSNHFSIDTLRALGAAEEYLGNKKTAKQIYKKVLELSPGDKPVFRHLSRLQLKDFELKGFWQTFMNFADHLSKKSEPGK